MNKRHFEPSGRTEMLSVRRADERGHTQLDWLDSWHTFSFDQYYDPKHMAFGPLRVINEDTIAPGGGFGTHPHRDMEIITYVIEGELRHQDSLGNGSVISPGEVQKMSAGSGILHSEYNASKEQPVHLLQIWIVPNKHNIKPTYEQERFELTPGVWKLLGGPSGDALVSIQQKAKLYGLSANPNSNIAFAPESGSKLWIQVVRGACSIHSISLSLGDGLAIGDDTPIEIITNQETQLLLFELLSGQV